MAARTTFWKVNWTTTVAQSVDHGLGDTILHSWEVLAKLLAEESCKDIIVDVGM
jgi:hypothetical protein